MRCVLITPFGAPVEPEVNRNLPIVSGPTLRAAPRRPPGPRGSRGSRRAGRRGPSVGGLRAGDHLDVAADRPRRCAGANGAPSLTKTRPGRQDVEDALQLAEILGDQRIGRRHRRVGQAGDHRAEADQRVIDAVARQDRDRALGEARGR